MTASFPFCGKLWQAVAVCSVVMVSTSMGETLQVPEDHASIGAAISESAAGDTVLVNHGVYPEQLRYPTHLIYVMSYFALTQDPVDIEQTIIEGYSYADQDTATIALFLPGAANGSKLCGFTLRGGHGLGSPNGPRFCGVFWANSCSPEICHNIITDNQTDHSPVGQFYQSSGIFRGNRVVDNVFTQTALRVNYNLYSGPVLVEDNYFGPNPRAINAQYPGIMIVTGARVLIHNNTFRGLSGSGDLVISAHGVSQIEIVGNTFDSLSAVGSFSDIIWLYDTQQDCVVVRDNVFSHIDVDDGAVLMITYGRNIHDVLLEGNMFESAGGTQSPSTSPNSPVWLEGYSGVVRNNIFLRNRGTWCGGVYFTSGSSFTVPAGLLFEQNLFETCSTALVMDAAAACTMRGAYSGAIAGHRNIFRGNSPRVVGTDAVNLPGIADFTLNYWGHPSGPYHPVHNPQGLGDAVGDSVLFDPWLLDSNITAVPEPPPPLPTAFKLESYPNPFNPETRLKLTVAEPGRYRLELFDIAGRRVRELFDGAVVIDREVTVNAGDLPSGMYFAHATRSLTRYPVATAKLVLLK